MNIKIHSSELNRMMKTLSQCINPKDQYRSNVEVIYDNNMLTIRGTDGQVSAVMSAPILGGDGEVFCVDGSLFAKVCAMCSGDGNPEFFPFELLLSCFDFDRTAFHGHFSTP